MGCLSFLYMKYLFLCLICVAASTSGQTQPAYAPLPAIPEAVSNNAVTGIWLKDTFYVYSFAGINASKLWSGIHLKAWCFNYQSKKWQALPSLPDPAGGKIAAAASTVKNRIYVIGGYHVAANGTETSSNKVHRFDPITQQWLGDGTPVPKAIDDHVQAVWRDSLIYVVTGWSNTQNVADVQVYNPAKDIWLSGTSVPNQTNYKVFGASGVIYNDTLYYCGGARDGNNFPPTTFFRKGYINPNNPTQISWSGSNQTAARGYRMAAALVAGRPVWIGGSDITYNYNGIAYNGSGGVPALSRFKEYHPENGTLVNNPTDTLNLPAIMDLRGTAQLASDVFITVGGMGPGQQVSDRVFVYHWNYAVPVAVPAQATAVKMYPNPASDYVDIEAEGDFEVVVSSTLGVPIASAKGQEQLRIFLAGIPTGAYTVSIQSKHTRRNLSLIII